MIYYHMTCKLSYKSSYYKHDVYIAQVAVHITLLMTTRVRK